MIGFYMIYDMILSTELPTKHKTLYNEDLKLHNKGLN